MSTKAKLLSLALLTLAAITAMLFIRPIPQDPAYHSFADQRTMFGISNFMNVMSNIPFLMIGIYGLMCLAKRPARFTAMYAVLFTGILLTGAGSAYYHYIPNNDTLVWDRLPMTLVFMAFLSATIAERIDAKAGARLLLPLLIAGIASVWWWHRTEQQGTGDLRAYALVQFYPMIAIPLIMLLFRPSSPDPAVGPLVRVMLWYVIAKVCEHFDKAVFLFTHSISGHSLKHIAASVATYFIVVVYIKRYPLTRNVQRS